MDRNELRSQFAAAMSAIYRQEVPLYGNLVQIVGRVNQHILSAKNAEVTKTTCTRLTAERHGAIRLGTPHELQTVKRIFALLGMYSVDYYDLSVAGLPMHATSFRPIISADLDQNPFRVFTTLLRPELVQAHHIRELALKLLEGRNMFTPALLDILNQADSQSGMITEQQASVFIPEALKSFTWQPEAAATYQDYRILEQEHPILADICCFKTAHLNHLTPRTLDIDLAQQAMRADGMAVKARIEGPPARECPILLRQTSFLALDEKINFRSDADESATKSPSRLIRGSHRARFGEIEQRGVALTQKGRKLYDELLKKASDATRQLPAEEAENIFQETFQRFPDTWEDLRQQQLAYFEYRCVKQSGVALQGKAMTDDIIEQCIEQGYMEAVPLTFEDFLPFSAAGIFQSNLHGSNSAQHYAEAGPDLEGFKRALGETPIVSHDSYSNMEAESLRKVAKQFGLEVN